MSDHRQGRQGRDYTPEQHAAVKRVMRCRITAYYEILDIHEKATAVEIKKSYRRLALTMHPDKNSAPQADEAFKRISRAFQVLSDEDKKRIFDQTGQDPDDRRAPSFGAGPSSFSGARASGHPFAGAGGGPEDLFNMFFGGAGPGPGTTFTFGGPGGASFHTFGGGGPDIFEQFVFGRPRQARQQARNPRAEPPNTIWTQLLSILPIALLLGFPLLVSLFSDSESAPKIPAFRFDAKGPYKHELRTSRFDVPFYIRESEANKLTPRDTRKLQQSAETSYVNTIRSGCTREYMERQQMMNDAIGFLGLTRDEKKWQEASDMEMPACDLLDRLGISHSLL